MNQYVLCVLVVAGLTTCAKKEEAVPANTLQFTVKGAQGQQLSFSPSVATVTLSDGNTVCLLTAKTADANFNFELVTGGSSVAVPGTYSASQAAFPAIRSQYGYQVVTDFTNRCGTIIYKNDYITYQTYSTNAPACTLVIRAVDPARHTISGSFSGTYWKGCGSVEIVDGQFNLPYLTKP